jgi:hypothetical protein
MLSILTKKRQHPEGGFSKPSHVDLPSFVAGSILSEPLSK